MWSALKELAERLGFVASGICPAARPPHFDSYVEWIRAGRHGSMTWMERSLPLREDPGKLLPGCKAVICLAYPYSADRPNTEDGLIAARYCEPTLEDYHERLRNKCKEISRAVLSFYPGSKVRTCVDSAPVLERAFAFSAGLGFIGKNSSLIVPGHGSYVFLAEILTTAPIAFESPNPINTLCGSCRLCLEACPAGALHAPYSMDASRCLSFKTIEDGTPVDSQTASLMGRCFLGCDICQEVCPHNRMPGKDVPVLPHSGEMLLMDEETFAARYGKTALGRPGLRKIKENIKAVLSQCPHRV